MLKGEQWKQTKIPKNPFEINHTHAEAALKILDAMIVALSERLGGQIHDGWLELITVKDDEGLHQYKAPDLQSGVDMVVEATNHFLQPTRSPRG